MMDAKRRHLLYIVAVTLCFGAGVALRLYGAWAARYIANPDCGIAALMAKHISQGEAFPVFFYGQAYMGSLEPAVSALFCMILGTSGFAVCLGTAFLGMLLLPVVFLWAKDAGGNTAGLAALAVCVIGPHAFFMFQAAPRGGYMATLVLGTVVMWLCANAAESAWRGTPVSAGKGFLMGLMAGLGWWTNQLILAALLSAFIVIMIGHRGRPPLKVAIAAAAAFLIGSLPFWLWNATHAWATFDVAASLGTISAKTGLSFLAERYTRLMGYWSWPGMLRVAALALPIILVVTGFVWGVFRLRKDAALHIVCIGLFIGISLCLFARSSYATMNTARYLLPLVPVAAVLIGFTSQALVRRFSILAAALPVIMVFAGQLHVFAEVRHLDRRVAAHEAFLGEFERFFERHKIVAAYGDYVCHAFNFNLDESVAITPLNGERYPPFARRAELAERFAVIGNTGKLNEFLSTAGGERKTFNVAGQELSFGFVPPSGGLSAIDPSQVSSIVDQDEHDIRAKLIDLNLDTAAVLENGHGRHAPSVTLRLKEPVTLRMIRLVAPRDAAYPRSMKVEALRAGRDTWDILFDNHVVTRYFWSGARFYNNGSMYRLEYRLRDAEVRAIRFSSLSPGGGTHAPWWLSEIQLFAPDAPLAETSVAFPELVAQLRSNRIDTVYCDRWVSNRLHADFGAKITTMLDAHVFPGIGLDPKQPMRLSPSTAMVVASADATANRDVLARHGLSARETVVGPWIVFQIGKATSGAKLLHWAGFGCLTGHSRKSAYDLLGEAYAAMAAGDSRASVRALLLRAAAHYPNILSAATELEEWLGDDFAMSSPIHPRTFVYASFSTGVSLEGITLSSTRVEPGEVIDITYYWRALADAIFGHKQVFVHFRNTDIAFQDNHSVFNALDEAHVRWQPYPEMFVRTRRVVIPHDTAPGDYAMHIGIYDVRTGRRSRVNTERPKRNRAVVIDNFLHVDG
jgi:hypothetical protein